MASNDTWTRVAICTAPNELAPGPRTMNDCAGGGQQQFTLPDTWMKQSCLNWGTIPAFAWGDRGNPQKTSVRITAAPTEIRTEHFPSATSGPACSVSMEWLDVCRLHLLFKRGPKQLKASPPWLSTSLSCTALLKPKKTRRVTNWMRQRGFSLISFWVRLIIPGLN
jgi:hypothetical protein